jgi:hypothetical protein
VSFRTQPRRRGPRRARPTRGVTLGGVLVLIGLLALVGGLVTVGRNAAAPRTVPGTAHPVPTSAAQRSDGTVAPFRAQDDWTTLSNPDSGLSYQIPPTGWSTNPQVGKVGSVTLAQGAERTAYTCGKPLERLLRGVLGSGSAPHIDPGSLAASIAQSAANQYYATGSSLPKVAIGPARPVQRRTRSGALLRGVLVRATATQHADPCLASTGELLVFVLQFPDHDGVLLVNADVAGGPAQPAPATDGELLTIVGTARPTK